MLYYASAHPDGGQSLLSGIRIFASSDWSPAILAMAKLDWSCQPGFWAPPAGVAYGVGEVQDCRDASMAQASQARFMF